MDDGPLPRQPEARLDALERAVASLEARLAALERELLEKCERFEEPVLQASEPQERESQEREPFRRAK